MCKDCGCGETHHHAGMENHQHAHVGPDGKVYFHTHDAPKVVELGTAVLAGNDRKAAENRKFFRDRGMRVFNLISSPGSGKTELLVKTLEKLHAEKIPCAVIVGDQYGELDAERMRKIPGVPVTQIQVHDACHLNAEQVGAVLEKAVPAGTKIVFIENVGNLVCPVAFDLGEDEKVALLSTPEGEEKPLKYPGLFASAGLVLLTKCDLAGPLGWNEELCRGNVRKIHPEVKILELSARTGQGLDGWISYLKSSI